MRLCGRFCFRHWQLAAKRLKKDQATDSCLARAARSESSATQFLSLTYVKCSDICANRTCTVSVCVCVVCVFVISSSSASREREVYRAKGGWGEGDSYRELTLLFLWPQHLTPATLLFAARAGKGNREGGHHCFHFIVCLNIYTMKTKHFLTHTHAYASVCVCLCVFMSVCPNTLFFGALACLIYERCCVCSLLLVLLLLLPCVVVVVLLVPAVLLFLLLLTQSYTYDMIFYTRLPIMTC